MDVKVQPLAENHLFRRAYRRGVSAAEPALVLYVVKNRLPHSRVGFTVSTKLGNAVRRNRLRRRLRHCFYELEAQAKPGFDLVIVARNRAGTEPFSALLDQLRNAMMKCKVFVE